MESGELDWQVFDTHLWSQLVTLVEGEGVLLLPRSAVKRRLRALRLGLPVATSDSAWATVTAGPNVIVVAG